MAEDKENQRPIEPQRLEQDKLNLYKGVIYREAIGLLAKHLPEALPQEPTEIFIGTSPLYIGRFRDKHYIALERDPRLDPAVQAMAELIEDIRWTGEQYKLRGELEHERLRLINDKAEKGDFDFEEIDQRIDHELDLIGQMTRPVVDNKLQPHQDPEELAKGPGQYQPETWRHIYMLVHELIHQKQAELNPSAFPNLTPPELESSNPDTMSDSQLYPLLLESHRAYTRSQDKDSLFYPVVEGMAALGSFYVMGRFADELTGTGEDDAANKMREVRRTQIRMEIIDPKRQARITPGDRYDINYVEGLDIMRRLYKNVGLENTPTILVSVDLAACRQVIKGSPEYQQMIRNPTQLPGLQKAA